MQLQLGYTRTRFKEEVLLDRFYIMRLLTELIDINELNRIKILFESKGIPVFVGNEDSARNMGLLIPARQYEVFVIFEEQFYDAQCLLKDEHYIVGNQVDMNEYRRHLESIKPNVNNKMPGVTIIIGMIVALIFIILVWVMNAVDA